MKITDFKEGDKFRRPSFHKDVFVQIVHNLYGPEFVLFNAEKIIARAYAMSAPDVLATDWEPVN